MEQYYQVIRKISVFRHTVAVYKKYSSSRPVDVQGLDRDLQCGVFTVSVTQRQNFCEIESF